MVEKELINGHYLKGKAGSFTDKIIGQIVDIKDGRAFNRGSSSDQVISRSSVSG
jgi:hypothetical protein